MNEEEAVERALDELVVELTGEAESIAHRRPKDVIVLVGYIFSELFGSERGSRSWH
jgi:hypothetical protein